MATITTASATAHDPATEAPAAPGFRLYRMSVDRYNRMVEAGVFCAKDPVFLWEGLLVEKMTKGRPHVVAQNSLVKMLDRLVPDGWYVEQDQPFDVGGRSVPEPDVKVVRGTLRDYLDRNPTPRDVPLVVEVADSSLAVDAGEVREVYAREGVAVYWIVNLPRRRIDVYTGPSGPTATPTYEGHQSYGPDDEVPVVLDGREVGRVPVREVLP